MAVQQLFCGVLLPGFVQIFFYIALIYVFSQIITQRRLFTLFCFSVVLSIAFCHHLCSCSLSSSVLLSFSLLGWWITTRPHFYVWLFQFLSPIRQDRELVIREKIEHKRDSVCQSNWLNQLCLTVQELIWIQYYMAMIYFTYQLSEKNSM